MSCKQILWVIVEIEDGKELGVCYLFESIISKLALSVQRNVVPRKENGVLE